MPQAFRIAMVPAPPEEVPLSPAGYDLFYLCETCWQIVGWKGWDDHVAFHVAQTETVDALDVRITAVEDVVVEDPPE